jgi:putative ABC transport system permease protein
VIRTGGLTPLPTSPFQAGLRVSAPDLAAGDSAFNVAGRLPQVPRSGGRGVLVDLGATATGPSVSPALSTYAVWLAADDPAKEAVLRHQLGRHGLHVLARDTASAHAAALASEGPSLALRLALLAGAVAVVLAAAVLVVGVATSGANRARDLAGLRIVGVPATTVTRASVREHLVVAVLGVIAGSVLGLLAAQAALPQIPLFATRNRFLPLVLDPAWVPVTVTVVGCLVVLGAVSVVVGRALAAAAVPERLREGA